MIDWTKFEGGPGGQGGGDEQLFCEAGPKVKKYNSTGPKF